MALQHLNLENYDTILTSHDGLQVVDFFATWCGPCKMLAPVLEKTAQLLPDVNFYKVDIDESASLAERYQIMSVPTLLFFKGDQLVEKSIGVISGDEIKRILEKHN